MSSENRYISRYHAGKIKHISPHGLLLMSLQYKKRIDPTITMLLDGTLQQYKHKHKVICIIDKTAQMLTQTNYEGIILIRIAVALSMVHTQGNFNKLTSPYMACNHNGRNFIALSEYPWTCGSHHHYHMCYQQSQDLESLNPNDILTRIIDPGMHYNYRGIWKQDINQDAQEYIFIYTTKKPEIVHISEETRMKFQKAEIIMPKLVIFNLSCRNFKISLLGDILYVQGYTYDIDKIVNRIDTDP